MKTLPLLVLLWTALQGLSADHPNVVFLISDDQRADTIAALGNRFIKTPSFDSLAKTGFSFQNAFCMGGTVGAVCAPSRAMLLTGRSLFRAVNAQQDPGRFLPDNALIPELFRKAGYTTAGIGKWHNPPAAYQRCFSEGGPIFFGGMGNPYKLPVQDYDASGDYPKSRQRPSEKHATELFTDAAVKFLEREHSAPFLLYVAFTSPHDPRIAPPRFRQQFPAGSAPLPPNFLPEHPFDNGEMKIRDEALLPWPRTRETVERTLAEYYACISHLDEQVGRILAAMRAKNLEKNTIVVFTSDHGLAVGSHGLLGKQNMYDHSMRAPLLIRAPGIPGGRRSDALCYLYDIFPTVADLAGLAAPGGIEGRSLRGIMSGETTSIRDHLFCAYRHVQRMYRTPEWKLIYYPLIDRRQLFNIARDSNELKDLASEPGQQPRLAEMVRLLEEARQANGDPHWKPTAPAN
jgi:arylsulfatase A-like enzyme